MSITYNEGKTTTMAENASIFYEIFFLSKTDSNCFASCSCFAKIKYQPHRILIYCLHVYTWRVYPNPLKEVIVLITISKTGIVA